MLEPMGLLLVQGANRAQILVVYVLAASTNLFQLVVNPPWMPTHSGFIRIYD
jgi:hypothetical protein